MHTTQALGMLAGAALVALALFGLPGGCTDETDVSSLVETLTAGLAAVADTDDEETTSTATETANTDEAESTASEDELFFPDPPPSPHMRHHAVPLTEEQQAALAAVQEAFDAGEITQDEYCAQMQEILGDPPCDLPLPPIALTEEQQAQAEDIYQAAHDQIVTLHATARENVLALLTEKQRQALEELSQPPALPEGAATPPEPLCPPTENSACARPADVPLAPCPEPPAALVELEAIDVAGEDLPPPPPPGGRGPAYGPRGPEGPGGRHGPAPLCLSPDTIETLGLTDEQVTAIESLHETLRTATQQVRDDATTAFEALLTEDQLAELDELPPPPPHHWW